MGNSSSPSVLQNKKIYRNITNVLFFPYLYLKIISCQFKSDDMTMKLRGKLKDIVSFYTTGNKNK